MKKSDFLNHFNNEEASQVLRVYDKLVLASKTKGCIFLNEFLTPNMWSKLSNIAIKFDVNFHMFGGFDECDRRMIAFYVDYLDEYPVKCLQIKNKSKFSKLEHKDYLGGLMSLGLKREKFGDLILKDDSCYLIVCEDVFSYIIENLSRIGKNPCSIEIVDNISDIMGPKLKSEIVTATSMRLDCIISAITGLSRNKCLTLISGGKVLVNYTPEHEKNTVVNFGTNITIRGYGKFKIVECIGSSGSGRLKLDIKKYI